jgi:ABC-type multidrug transport system permease subunit
MFIGTFSNIIGAVILISIVLPWFLISVVIVSILYSMAAAFYRASAREMKVRVSLVYPYSAAERDTLAAA